MDNLSFADLLPLISKLSENPAMMSALSGMMGGSAPQRQESPKSAAQDDGISALLSALGGAKNTEPQNQQRQTEQGRGGLGKMLGTQEEIKNRIVLLNALRPYLSEARREKLETVIKLMRLAEIGALSSLLK